VASGALARRIVVDEIRSTLSTYDDRERAQFGERQREFLFLRWRNRAALAAATLFSLILTGGLSLLVYQSGRDLTQAGARLSAANLELEAINANLAAANSSLHESNELLNREVVERAVAEQRLSETVAELERSNADLEQFAYVASHDLQEPLRAIGGCVQLLKRRHGNQLDARADELIGHAVDGALRMQNLINDLLTYSRVGTRGGTPLARVDLNHILEDVLRLLRVPISESGAKIVYSDLPIVRADGSQLELVLQNLISNAIKFRAEGEPIISVSCRRQFTESVPQWVVTVADNGLGIEPQYFERIFVMFQRLHTREEFPGTGIGLAICKKIVERHGGRIWLESEVGKGTKFHFTLPVMDEGAASPEGAPAV
jgi:light-regulated signal transduction histidine kinase (bacteriophytochrome)